jgi:hypothetical protein
MGKSEYKKISDLKKKTKENLYKSCWPQDKTTKPLVLIFAPKKNEDVLFQILQGCTVLTSNFIVISETEPPNIRRGKLRGSILKTAGNSQKSIRIFRALIWPLFLMKIIIPSKNLWQTGWLSLGMKNHPSCRITIRTKKQGTALRLTQ